MHIFACSNSSRALQLSSDDRRWFVPKVTNIKQSPAYWTEFNNWLSNHSGLRIIKHWAKVFLQTHEPVIAGANAPWSQAKKEVIEEGYSPGMIFVNQFLEKAKEECPPDTFILDVDLVKLISDFVYEGRPSDRLEKPATIRKLAKSNGWMIGEKRTAVAEWGLRKSMARIISMDASVVATEGPALNAAGKRPLDVNAKAQAWLAL
jgi:hypothetical protein